MKLDIQKIVTTTMNFLSQMEPGERFMVIDTVLDFYCPYCGDKLPEDRECPCDVEYEEES